MNGCLVMNGDCWYSLNFFSWGDTTGGTEKRVEGEEYKEGTDEKLARIGR